VNIVVHIEDRAMTGDNRKVRPATNKIPEH
jgi:hypothetical protein